MKRISLRTWLSVVSAAALVAAASATAAAGPRKAASKYPNCTVEKVCKVALIISSAGLGDKGFNDLAYAGMQRAAKILPIDGQPIQDPQIATQGVQVLTEAANAGYQLIIDLSYSTSAALEQVAKKFPHTHFVLVDNVEPGRNITNEMFDVQDSSFLVGALAAMVNEDTRIPGINGKNTIGAIGGVKSPGIDQFLVGYQEGAQYINPKENVLIAYANTFADPATGAELANSMFSQGATVVYQVAGVTGLGVIQAAQKRGLYAIGVDSNQDSLAPGHVLTSSIKRTDTAVYDAILMYAQGKLKGDTTLNFGLQNNGVALSPMTFTRHFIPAKDLRRLAHLEHLVRVGKLHVWNVPTQGYPKWFVAHQSGKK